MAKTKSGKLFWQKMEKSSKETPEEIARKKEFHRVIEKIRKLPKRDEAGPSSSKTQQSPIEDEDINTHQRDEIETMYPTQTRQYLYRQSISRDDWAPPV